MAIIAAKHFCSRQNSKMHKLFMANGTEINNYLAINVSQFHQGLNANATNEIIAYIACAS